jgi:hypothetical protein
LCCEITAGDGEPNHPKGEVLFKQMVQQRLDDAHVNSPVPNMYLNAQHSEAQVKEFGPDAKDKV